MAVTLVGEIIDSADSATGYTNGNISGDDDFVEGTGAVGLKISNTTTDIVQTSLPGAGAPYDFSVGGTEEGWHIIMWFNTKTPVNATSGLRVRVGNGTNTGDWYVIGTSFYKGGFVTRVIDTAADFDVVSGWSLTGNPAQLTAVSECGAVFTTTTSIMGSFNNCQVDQFTAGLGLRVDAGTVGTPNTFETVRAADEDTAFYGWWSSSNGAVIGKGKLYIGPSTGSATSVFTDTAFSVIFADERVAVGFYEIETRGAGTDVTWDLASIAAANSTNARWTLTIDSTTNSFADTNGVWTGSDQIVLDAAATLTGTTIIDGTRMTQNSADINDITVLDPNVGSGVAYLLSNNPSLITGSTFESSGAGHAIEINTAGTYTFTDNTFGTGYSGTGNNAAIWFNPSGGTGDLVLNASGGNITAGNIRNSSSGSVTVNNNVNVTLTGLVNPTEVRVYDLSGNALQGQEDVTTGSYIISQSAGTVVDIRIYATSYLPADIENFTIPSSNTSLPIQQVFDRNYKP
jgi:hypothetical protein